MFVILPRKCQVCSLSWSSFYKISHCVRSTLVFQAKKGLKGLLRECENLSLQKQKRELKISLVWGKTIESVKVLSRHWTEFLRNTKNGLKYTCRNRVQFYMFKTNIFKPRKILGLVWWNINSHSNYSMDFRMISSRHLDLWVAKTMPFSSVHEALKPAILFIHVLRALNGFTNSR